MKGNWQIGMITIQPPQHSRSTHNIRCIHAFQLAPFRVLCNIAVFVVPVVVLLSYDAVIPE